MTVETNTHKTYITLWPNIPVIYLIKVEGEKLHKKFILWTTLYNMGGKYLKYLEAILGVMKPWSQSRPDGNIALDFVVEK